MLARFALAATVVLAAASQVLGQAATPQPESTTDSNWRRAGDAVGTATTTPEGDSASAPTPKAAGTPAGRGVSPVGATATLPNKHGQVWREYDISPYTLRVTTTSRPEQAIIDWVLRETGYEAWHSEPLGILSATARTLRVYHTPEMQAVVADLVDRFVSTEAESSTFSLRVVTVNHPNWRARAQQLLRPVMVQTPGIGAWLVQKEDAAVLLADLRRRSDYREHSSPHLMVNNGQSTVVSTLRSRNYIKDVTLRPEVWPGYEVQPGQIDEGFSMEFSPLLSADQRTIDATIKCNIDQVEKMVPVMIDVPVPSAPRQRAQIDVPQITQFRFHERFRWPVDHVLLVGMGMVALPVPADAKPLVPGIPLPIGSTPPRADLLVFVESQGKSVVPAQVSRSPLSQPKTYRGRY
ncbi:MAG: hypothetical protein JXB62_07165 [Pirellulales bacterium]|nr:hypothetical protein [Pirellulales bacterium]